MILSCYNNRSTNIIRPLSPPILVGLVIAQAAAATAVSDHGVETTPEVGNFKYIYCITSYLLYFSNSCLLQIIIG